MKKLVVLISGQGNTLQAIMDACGSGKIQGEITAVISDKADAFGLQRAKTANLDTAVFERSQFADNAAMDQAIGDYIRAKQADLIVLAGYMRILSADFVQRFAGKILNIHPSLLPKFPGLHTYRRALEAGESEHGTTVHFVNEEMDTGAIVLQAKVPVFPEDGIEDIEKRVKARELQIYPLAVQWFVDGRLKLQGAQAFLDGNLLPPQGYAAEE